MTEQRQIWFSDQLAPDATFNTVPVYVEITGELDADALAAAINAVVDRHEPLRTSYRLDGDELVSDIAAEVHVPIAARDLRELPPAERAARAEALVANELARRIDISSGLPLRVVLLRLDDDRHQLVLLVHHIAIDGASVSVLQDELVRSYQAAVSGGEVSLPRPKVAYRDIVVPAEGVEFWREELDDLPEPLELPNIRTRPAQPDFAAETLPLVVPEELADAVRQLASTHRSSSFMVLLTAFSVLLHRLTGSSDIVVGSPSAGREHADTHDLVGYFVNMLALRVRLGWDPTYAEAMDSVRNTVLDALDHRDTPFHEVVTALGQTGDVDRHPVFQVVFASPPPLAGPLAAGGCVFTFTQGTSSQGLYDLELQLSDSGSGELRGWVKFRTALYRRADVQDLTERFLTVLGQITSAPDARLSNLSLLSTEETLRIVRDLNANATAYPAGATLVELFEQTVDRHAEDVAVEFGTTRLSYAELDQRANRLATHLGPLTTPVGILADRGVDWITAAIAVLKAGGAYLPLDPEYPIERLQALCDDAGARVVITDRPAALTGVELVDLSGMVLTCPADRPQRPISPDDLAYVMYTSGSTGMPKGVCVSHRNVTRLVRDTNYVEFGPGDRVAQASTTTFDAATFEIWGALLNGGRLVGLPKDIALDPAALGEWLRANEIDTLFLTTSVAMHVAREAPAALSSLRYFVFGGEQPDSHAVATLIAHPGGPEHVVNGYGPTETTTFASSHECERAEGRIPLGRGLSNTQLYVLDQYLEPVPPMVAGELCIGGDGVGRGYVGNPALTAEKFVPDHLGGKPGARLYRTGDRARLLPDGTFEYLGRADRQVKIRGFRIEPGEVEACLHSSGLVRQAVVVPREDAAGDVGLVGYVVLERSGADQLDELMRHVRDALPAYLVPSALVPLETLPLTRNGKLDLRALPAPEAVEEPEVEEPRTLVEVAVANVWRQVLGAESIGRDANFFDLGGHSLKAAKILSRIEGELGVRLPMRSLFDHPTVAGISTEVERVRDTTPVSVGAPTIRAESRSGLSVADLLDL